QGEGRPRLFGWKWYSDKKREEAVATAASNVEKRREEADLGKLREKVHEIAALLGAGTPVVVFDPKVYAAQARGDGTIHVNREWFNKTCVAACTTHDAVCARAFAYWLLGHEVAHFVFKDPKTMAAVDAKLPELLRRAEYHRVELRADWYGGL